MGISSFPEIFNKEGMAQEVSNYLFPFEICDELDICEMLS